MDTTKRITAASAAAVLGLLLAGCDNTEETPEAPAGTAVPENDVQESEIGGEAGDTGGDATTGADDMVPEADPEVGEGEAGGGGY